MRAPRYTPPCRLHVKRRFLVGAGLWLDPGDYRVWWGRDRWVIDPVLQHVHRREPTTMLAFRPQERSREPEAAQMLVDKGSPLYPALRGLR